MIKRLWKEIIRPRHSAGYNNAHGPYSRQVWRINWFIEMNLGWAFWGILTLAVGLQQFEATEPATLGAFWINLIALILAISCASGAHNSDPRHLAYAVLIQIGALLLQVYLIIFHWSDLCRIDAVLRHIRSLIVGGHDHRIIGWCVWSLCTFIMFRSCYQAQCFVRWRVPQRPW